MKNIPKYLSRYSSTFFGIWTLFVIIMLSVELYQVHNATLEMAINEARTHFNRDQAFRLWGTSHGGVYVPIDENTPPNPYLSHLKDRDLEVSPGKKLTLMNPAYMVRQMSEFYSDLYGVKGHLTSLKTLRPENAPDEWEKKALNAFEKGEKEVLEFTKVDGKPYLRLMQPMITKKGCLKCHGQQGYKVGDIRGGVGISLPMELHLANRRKQFIVHIIGYFLIWALGIGGISFCLRGLRQRWKTMEELQESENRLAKAQRIANVGNWDWDIVNNKLWWSDEIYHIFGLKPKEFEATYEAFLNSVHPDDRKFVEISVNDALSKKIPYNIDHRIILPDGTERIVNEQAEVYFKKEKPVKMIGTVQDITDRKRAEKALKESEERFRTIYESAPVGIILVDSKGRIISANPASEKIFGYSESELKEKTFKEISHPGEIEENLKLFNEMLKGKRDNYSLEKRYYHKNGSIIWGNIIVSAVRDKKGNFEYCVAIQEDITEKKKVEKERKDLLQRLGKRIKELNGLYSLSKLSEQAEDFEEIFNLFVNDIAPQSMQYPEKAIARIEYDGKSYFNSDKDIVNKLTAPIIVSGKQRGTLTIGYIEDLPFNELFEKQLINSYAEHLGRYVEK